MSNASKMDEMVQMANQDYNIKSDAQEPNAPDYSSKIQLCRGNIRQLELLDYDAKKVLQNFYGVLLHRDVLDIESIGWRMKSEFVKNVYTSKSFVKAATPSFKLNIFINNDNK